MCRTPTLITLLLLAAETTALSAQGGGYFGAPVLKVTPLRDQGALLFGGRGGWNVSPSLTLGGGLYGTLTEVDAPVEAVSGPLDVKLESFGIEFEYAASPASARHLTAGAFLGGAGIRYTKDKTNEQDGETDFVLMIEPAIGVEQAVNEWLHAHVALSYRLLRGVDQAGLAMADVRGPALALGLKFGRF